MHAQTHVQTVFQNATILDGEGKPTEGIRLGSPAEVVRVLKKGNIDFVAMKIHDGTGVYQNLEPYL